MEEKHQGSRKKKKKKKNSCLLFFNLNSKMPNRLYWNLFSWVKSRVEKMETGEAIEPRCSNIDAPGAERNASRTWAQTQSISQDGTISLAATHESTPRHTRLSGTLLRFIINLLIDEFEALDLNNKYIDRTIWMYRLPSWLYLILLPPFSPSSSSSSTDLIGATVLFDGGLLLN